jgi:spore coat protein CotF
MINYKWNQFIAGLITWTIIVPAYAEILTLANGSGKLQDSVCVQLSVDTADPVYGAVFSLDYSSDIILSSIESQYFDTFDAQMAKAYGESYTEDLSAYGPSFVFKTNIDKGETYVAAARFTETVNTQAMFELCFVLKDGASANSYPIYIKPIPQFTENGSIDPDKEPHPVLTSVDTTYPYTSHLAYPVLLSGETDPSGHALNTRHGMVTFSTGDDSPDIIHTVTGQITSDILGKTDSVANATVKLVETGQIVKTDTNGYYTFTNVQEGQYTVEASSPVLGKNSFQVNLSMANAIISNIMLRQVDAEDLFTATELQNAVSQAVVQAIADQQALINALQKTIDDMYSLSAIQKAVQSAIYEKEQIISRMHLDIDCNGEADALTDGLMIMRYLFGINEGTSLTDNAVDTINGTCTSEAEIIANIERIMPKIED